MKKIRITFISILSILVGLSLAIALVSCKKTEDGANDGINVYTGTEKELSLHNWISGTYGIYDIEQSEEEDSFLVEYTKERGQEYSYLYCQVDGELGDFTYLNITASSDNNRALQPRIVYDLEDGSLESNMIGGEYDFPFDKTASTVSVKLKTQYRPRLDEAQFVVLYPDYEEMVLDRSSIRIERIWFSQTPAADVVNPNVDNSTLIEIGGWRTESWTKYKVKRSSGGVGVSFTDTADYAYMETDLTIGEKDSALDFSFINSGVTNICFILRGDVSGRGANENGMYDLYYESAVYTYDFYKESEASTEADGSVRLHIDIANGLDDLGFGKEGKNCYCTNGVRLALLIESNPDKIYYRSDGSVSSDRYGSMTILSVGTSVDENFVVDHSYELPDADYDLVNGIRVYRWTGFKATDNKDGSTTISYADVQDYALIKKYFELSEGEDTLVITFRSEDYNRVTTDSVDRFKVVLYGAFRTQVRNPGETPYNEYYTVDLCEWMNDSTASKNEDGTITLRVSLKGAFQSEEFSYDPARLAVGLSFEQNDDCDKKGKVTICSFEIVKDGLVNGWSAEMWTNYGLYEQGDDTVVTFVESGEWAFVSKEIALPEEYASAEELALSFSFVNMGESITHIKFVLRGDNYTLENSNQTELGVWTDGETVFATDVKDAVYTLMENGAQKLFLVVHIESDAEAKDQYDGVGAMRIDGCEIATVEQ